MPVEHLGIDKIQVALRFAQAGQSYTEHAVVQKKIAQQLFDLIEQYCPEKVNNVFEIGCGSGNLSHLLIKNLDINHIILNDLYTEIQHHFQNNPEIQYLIGDIERIDFPQNIDFIASSSVLQWVGHLDAVLQKAKQSLNTQGLLCFSTFAQKNLQEIKILTGQGLDYLSLINIQEKLHQNGFEILHLSEQIESMYFSHPKQVLQHLKATGVTATAQNFRWTKQSLADFYQAYQGFSCCDEFGQVHYPLTYHPIFCIARSVL